LIEKEEVIAKFSEEVPSLQEALQFGIDAIDRGDMKIGSDTMQWILEREPNYSLAWLWLACTVDDEGKKRECYVRASI
jgi:hypothetical protein